MNPQYSEAIFTRCRHGLNLLKGGEPMLSDGYKVYACTPSLLADGATDIPFLYSVLEAKQPFDWRGDALMDDAYLYLVPDHGPAIMVDFFPVPPDQDQTGDYDHRPGVYLTHALVGDFSAFYPFELFHDPKVWTARTRGQAHYYLTEPTPLPGRMIDQDPVSEIHADDLAGFVADGRQEALKAAVAFLVAQYGAPPESRKYLVIRDGSAENIERWIAAIEHAFSPRIAASVPFATRMNDFGSMNPYTVDDQGMYQTPGVSQGSAQRKRFRAMIVGVDERDRQNASSVAAMSNGAYVVLDGKAKRAMFEADASDPYYTLVTRFDDAHADFTRNFLSMVDLRQPAPDLHRLARAYLVLGQPASLEDVKAVNEAATVLASYRTFITERMQRLCDQVADRVPLYLRQDARAAFGIMDWLLKVAEANRAAGIGDVGRPQQLSVAAWQFLERQIYDQDDPRRALVAWDYVKATGFASYVASSVVDPDVISRHRSQRPLSVPMGVAFTRIYIESAALTGAARAQDVAAYAAHGVRTAFATGDDASARAIIAALGRVPGADPQGVLLQSADGSDPSYDRYILQQFSLQDPSIMALGAPLGPTIARLRAAGRENLVGAFALYRIDALRSPTEVDQFLPALQKALEGRPSDLVSAYQAMDGKLSLLDRHSVPVAITIQQQRPISAICPVSAHIYALEALADKRVRPQLLAVLASLTSQRFPSIEDPEYAHVLVERLGAAQLNREEWVQIVGWCARSTAYASALASYIVDAASSRQPEPWNVLVGVSASMSSTRDLPLYLAIVDACAHQRQGQKALAQLDDLLTTRAAHDHFAAIADAATAQMLAHQPQGRFPRFLHR